MATLQQVIHAHPAIAALRQQYPLIADALNAPTKVDNSVKAAPQVPLRIGWLEVFQAIATAAPADMAKAGLIPSWMIDRAEQMMTANDRLGMANWLTSIGAVAGLSNEAKSALTALLAQTEADPTWTEKIDGPSIAAAAGLPYVTAEMIQAADTNGGNW